MKPQPPVTKYFANCLSLFDSKVLNHYDLFLLFFNSRSSFLGFEMRICSIFIFLLFTPLLVFGGYSHVNGVWAPDRFIPLYSVQEHYDRGQQNANENKWDEALVHFMVIAYHFQESPFYADAVFQAGICYYFKSDFDLANKQFDRYLALGGKLKYFEKVFEYKLEIANQYASGFKKHMFGIGGLPRWAPAKGDSLDLYDEIIAALPGKEIAAYALYQKADLLKTKREYHEGIEGLQLLARRFPKHPLAAESYVRISEIYLAQSKRESQNPDLLALAQINIQKFAKSFPSDERVLEAKKNLLAMQEVYAQSLYETGRFYERKKKPHASTIYFEDTIQKYPETEAALKSRNRLARYFPQRYQTKFPDNSIVESAEKFTCLPQ
jgi:outer membrane protein assembly factor BamD (BamD/ComL family)